MVVLLRGTDKGGVVLLRGLTMAGGFTEGD